MHRKYFPMLAVFMTLPEETWQGVEEKYIASS
jgi:hypothetical protein